MTTDLRGKTAVVGVSTGGFPQMPPGSSPLDVMALASVAALEDAGLTLKDVDGVFAAGLQLFMPTLSLCEYLGIQPRYTDSTQIGGGAFLAHLNHAQAAIAAGLCNVALIAYGSTQRSGGAKFTTHSEANPYETPYGYPGPVAGYALMAQRYMHEYGVTRAQLADVAVSARKWAQLNPAAPDKTELTVEQVMQARPVADPFTVRDCCLVTDGGGAIVLVSAERAHMLRQRPVFLLGAGEAVSHRSVAQMPDLATTMAIESAGRAFKAAGVMPAEVDVVQFYDAFTVMPPLFAEDCGFCEKGEGGAFLSAGRSAPGGAFPMNTNGGGLSFGHPGMYGIFTVVESVLQLRGECGDRQVAGAEIALAHAPGGYMSSQSTVIFGTKNTL